MLIFHQLWLSMEHHKWDRINAPLHSKACFCFDFEVGLRRGAHIHNRFSWWRVQRNTTELSCYPVLYVLKVIEHFTLDFQFQLQ